MKVIFLATDKDKVNKVYAKELIEKTDPHLWPLKVFTKDEVIADKKSFKDVQFIFSTWYMPQFEDNEVRDLFPSLEALFYAAGTVRYFARPFLKAGVRVFSAASANGIPVAEFTLAQVILANKGYYQAQAAYRKPLYRLSFNFARRYMLARCGNYRACVGIIGAGAVGRRVIDLLKTYDLNIYVYDPYVPEEVIRGLGAEKMDLKDIFKKCDVISNHLPDIDSTKGLLDYNLFGSMKETATFINTGRGAQVVEKDMIKALKEKPLACAVLDVTGHEPLFPWSPLYRCRNAFITPHLAGSSGNEEQRMAEFVFDSYQEYITNGIGSGEVTAKMLGTMA